jgi:hypothetical protein
VAEVVPQVEDLEVAVQEAGQADVEISNSLIKNQ